MKITERPPKRHRVDEAEKGLSPRHPALVKPGHRHPNGAYEVGCGTTTGCLLEMMGTPTLWHPKDGDHSIRDWSGCTMVIARLPISINMIATAATVAHDMTRTFRGYVSVFLWDLGVISLSIKKGLDVSVYGPSLLPKSPMASSSSKIRRVQARSWAGRAAILIVRQELAKVIPSTCQKRSISLAFCPVPPFG